MTLTYIFCSIELHRFLHLASLLTVILWNNLPLDIGISLLFHYYSKTALMSNVEEVPSYFCFAPRLCQILLYMKCCSYKEKHRTLSIILIGRGWIQARSQGTFEVEALSRRGFGGRLEAPNWSRAKPWWGPRGRSPRKLMDFTH